MTLPENISLENIVKNPEYSLEIFKFEESTKVDASGYMYIPKEMLNQHFNKTIYTKISGEIISDEFMIWYAENKITADKILITKNNAIELIRISEQKDGNAQVKRLVKHFKYKTDLILKKKNGWYYMKGIPKEFRRPGDKPSFISNNEPYTIVTSYQNYVI